MSKQEKAVAAVTQCVNSVAAFITRKYDRGATVTGEEVEVDLVKTNGRRSQTRFVFENTD